VAFVVKLADGADTGYVHGGTPYEDDDSYQFLHDGVLKITKKADNTTTYYGPGIWHSVETKTGHAPEQTSRGPIKLPGITR
jgi:hypothetical protein